MPSLSPLPDTQRVVGWDELPPVVRELRGDFDPSADGVLMKHQAQWIGIRTPIKACPKGRRTGITFAEALDDTIRAASRKSAGGTNVYYIPDTKEKGLEFIGYCAKFSRVIAEGQGQVSDIEQFLFEDQDEKGNTKHITAYRIRFASGFQIVALSSRPASIRGLQGVVVIDEAAFHLDVRAVLDAATALLIWGGEIHVISSHNGKRNAFNEFVTDIEKGHYGPDAKVFTATFDDAVANGLYERVCFKKGDKPTAAGKKKWYSKIRSAYGPRKAAMREELDCIPRDGSGKCIPGVWIDRAMREERPVLRLALDDDFAAKPDEERRSWCDAWIKTHLTPLLSGLDRELQHVFGMDYARHRHFSVIAPGVITPTLRGSVPFVIEMSNVPTRQQEQILWKMIEGLPRFVGGGIDATGSGQTLAEYTADKFGAARIHQITLNRQWYGLWMPKMIQALEDGVLELPRDAALEADLSCVEETDGVPMVAKLEAKDVKDAELMRHGDFAIALAILWFARLNKSTEIEFQSLGRTRVTRQLEDFTGAL